MAQTIQPRSWTLINEAGKDLTIRKPEAEDNRRLLLSVFDSLNNLYETLSRLDYVLKRKNMELNIYRKKGDKNET